MTVLRQRSKKTKSHRRAMLSTSVQNAGSKLHASFVLFGVDRYLQLEFFRLLLDSSQTATKSHVADAGFATSVPTIIPLMARRRKVVIFTATTNNHIVISEVI